MLIVNPWHWMSEDEWFPDDNPRLRRKLLRIARLIEYGAELEPLQTRLTLVECTKRKDKKRCSGFLVVQKQPDDTLYAECMTCRKDQIIITDWQSTLWGLGFASTIIPPDPTARDQEPPSPRR